MFSCAFLKYMKRTKSLSIFRYNKMILLTGIAAIPGVVPKAWQRSTN